jgi:hypothetical protein
VAIWPQWYGNKPGSSRQCKAALEDKITPKTVTTKRRRADASQPPQGTGTVGDKELVMESTKVPNTEVLKIITLYEGMDKVTGEIRYYTMDERSGETRYYQEVWDYKLDTSTD